MSDTDPGEDVTRGSTGRRVAILGAGSWGTALAFHAAHLGHRVTLHSRSVEHHEQMRAAGENQRYFPGKPFPEGLSTIAGLGPMLRAVDLLVLAVPSHAMRDVGGELAREIASYPPQDLPKMYLVAAKGVEVDTLATMDEVLQTQLVGCGDRLAVLGGPSFAAEVVSGMHTAVVVASRSPQVAATVQVLLSGGRFRAYVSDDVRGVELGGASKNVIALAAGIGDGAGLGQNARAGLITRGLAEMSRLAVALGAQAATLSGLAGLGDLVLTCTGGLSRNRRVGVALGQGRQLAEILDDMGMVAEGVRNTRSVYQLGQREGVELPIVETMHEILYNGLTIPAAVQALMERTLKDERG